MFTDSLGNEYGEACILDLEVTWMESEPRTPLICILSIGSDPSPQITALAKGKEIRKYFTVDVFSSELNHDNQLQPLNLYPWDKVKKSLQEI